jgi:hypothetical protein
MHVLRCDVFFDGEVKTCLPSLRHLHIEDCETDEGELDWLINWSALADKGGAGSAGTLHLHLKNLPDLGKEVWNKIALF